MADTGCLWSIRKLGLVLAIFVAALVATALLMAGPCNDGKAACAIYGDSRAHGATAYADGQWLGVLGQSALDSSWLLNCRIPRGARRLLVVSTAGESLSTDAVFATRTVVWLSFADSTITAQPAYGD